MTTMERGHRVLVDTMLIVEAHGVDGLFFAGPPSAVSLPFHCRPDYNSVGMQPEGVHHSKASVKVFVK